MIVTLMRPIFPSMSFVAVFPLKNNNFQAFIASILQQDVEETRTCSADIETDFGPCFWDIDQYILQTEAAFKGRNMES